MEDVRLVIWDLDETFWRGTLSEGGITEYVQLHHDIVVELARRGIMSSIVSKNDEASVRAILQARGIWTYFIFPSINWSPKAPRIAQLIETIGLRASTVLFVDDNPHNRAEVERRVPGLTIDSEGCLPSLLSHPRCRGKDDSGLSRLAQYKVLERRRVSQEAAGSDGEVDFLRNCNIQVELETDVEAHLDRAIELLNRTNQLNFTKRRLPEDIDDARVALRKNLRPFWTRAALIRVRDDYGDYGFSGFYLASADRLLDFCFSCRILGMGVEEWLYARLGRPRITVLGEVLTDLAATRPAVDWINGSHVATGEGRLQPKIPEVRLRGGCDLSAVAHYVRLHAGRVIGETNTTHDGIFVRHDSTMQLLPQLLDSPEGFASLGCSLGFRPEDFESTFLAPAEPGTLLIYSPWADFSVRVYRHRATGFRYALNAGPEDLTSIQEAELEERLNTKGIAEEDWNTLRAGVQRIKTEFESERVPPPDVLQDAWTRLCARVPEGARLIIVLPCTQMKTPDGQLQSRRISDRIAALTAVITAFDNISVIDMDELVHGPDDMDEGKDHFRRIVYFRLFQAIFAGVDLHP